MISREDMAALREPVNADLLDYYQRERRRARAAERRVARYPARGGSQRTQLLRWGAKYDLKFARDGQAVAIAAAHLRLKAGW